MNPAALDSERNALIEEIVEAFKGVSREGGVAWPGTPHGADTGGNWLQLCQDGRWDPNPGVQFATLDPSGFRYYIAPAMILCLRGNRELDLRNPLFLDRGEFRRHILNQWALLDRRQRLAIGRFLRYMDTAERAEWADEGLDMESPTEWQEAYESYWKSECESESQNGDSSQRQKKSR